MPGEREDRRFEHCVLVGATAIAEVIRDSPQAAVGTPAREFAILVQHDRRFGHGSIGTLQVEQSAVIEEDPAAVLPACCLETISCVPWCRHGQERSPACLCELTVCQRDSISSGIVLNPPARALPACECQYTSLVDTYVGEPGTVASWVYQGIDRGDQVVGVAVM